MMNAKFIKSKNNTNEDGDILNELNNEYQTISALMDQDIDALKSEILDLFGNDAIDSFDMELVPNNNHDERAHDQNDDAISVHSLASTVAFPDDSILNDTNPNAKKRKQQNIDKEEKEDEFEEPPSKKRKIANKEYIVFNIIHPKKETLMNIKMEKEQKFGTIRSMLSDRFKKKVQFSFDGFKISDNMTPQRLIDEHEIQHGDIIDTTWKSTDIQSVSYEFEEGDKILCYHGPSIYKAEVLKRKISEETQELLYFITYNGWHSQWNEWVAPERCLSRTPQNIAKMKYTEELLMINLRKTSIEKNLQ